MANTDKTPKQKVEERYVALKNIREPWLNKWKQIQNHILPFNGLGLNGASKSEADQRNRDEMYYIIDSTPMGTADVLASGLMSGLASPSRPWFRLTTNDEELREKEGVKLYLDEVQRRMLKLFASSNLYNGLHHTFKELGGFCTAAMAILEDEENVIRTRNFTAGEFALATNFNGEVHAFYREMTYTAEQLKEHFGDRVTPQIKLANKNNRPDEKYVVVNVIEANDDRINIPQAGDFPYRSLYFLQGKTVPEFLEVRGFEENPIVSPRWEVTANSPYGRGPGFRVLPDCKMLQKMSAQSLKAVDKIIEPPLQAPGTLKQVSINTMPNGVTHVDSLSGDGKGIQPLYQIRPELAVIETKIEQTKILIRQGMYNDLFEQLALLPRKNMTATEVIERHEEKLLQLGPVLERLHNELLGPIIDRTYAIMDRRGLLPEPPPELDNERLEVRYISVLAEAQRLVGIGSIERFTSYIGELSTVVPSVLDNVDFDNLAKEYAEATGIGAENIIPPEIVAETREVRAVQAAQQQSLEIADQAANVAKTVSETDPNNEVLQQFDQQNDIPAPNNPPATEA